MLRKHLEFQAAASAHDQHSRILGSRFCEQEHRHALQISEAWNETRRTLRVPGHGLWIGENVSGLVHRRSSSARGASSTVSTCASERATDNSAIDVM
jgi:hypothetical protein